MSLDAVNILVAARDEATAPMDHVAASADRLGSSLTRLRAVKVPNLSADFAAEVKKLQSINVGGGLTAHPGMAQLEAEFDAKRAAMAASQRAAAGARTRTAIPELLAMNAQAGNARGLLGTAADMGKTKFAAMRAEVAASTSGLARMAKYAVGFGAAMGAVRTVSNSVHLAADFEQTNVAMRTMLKSGERAKNLLRDISQFAVVTPYQFRELADVSRKLLAYGIKDDQMMTTLKRLGDVASGVAAPLDEVATIYGKVAVKGQVFAREINQFTSHGIPIIGELAKQFGVADEAIAKMVENGDVHFKDIERAFVSMTSAGGQFAGMMDEQSKTLAGRWSTLKDNIEIVERNLGTATFPWLKELTDNLILATGAWNDMGGAAKTARDVAQASLFGDAHEHANSATFIRQSIDKLEEQKKILDDEDASFKSRAERWQKDAEKAGAFASVINPMNAVRAAAALEMKAKISENAEAREEIEYELQRRYRELNDLGVHKDPSKDALVSRNAPKNVLAGLLPNVGKDPRLSPQAGSSEVISFFKNFVTKGASMSSIMHPAVKGFLDSYFDEGPHKKHPARRLKFEIPAWAKDFGERAKTVSETFKALPDQRYQIELAKLEKIRGIVSPHVYEERKRQLEKSLPDAMTLRDKHKKGAKGERSPTVGAEDTHYLTGKRSSGAKSDTGTQQLAAQKQTAISTKAMAEFAGKQVAELQKLNRKPGTRLGIQLVQGE